MNKILKNISLFFLTGLAASLEAADSPEIASFVPYRQDKATSTLAEVEAREALLLDLIINNQELRTAVNSIGQQDAQSADINQFYDTLLNLLDPMGIELKEVFSLFGVTNDDIITLFKQMHSMHSWPFDAEQASNVSEVAGIQAAHSSSSSSSAASAPLDDLQYSHSSRSSSSALMPSGIEQTLPPNSPVVEKKHTAFEVSEKCFKLIEEERKRLTEEDQVDYKSLSEKLKKAKSEHESYESIILGFEDGGRFGNGAANMQQYHNAIRASRQLELEIKRIEFLTDACDVYFADMLKSFFMPANLLQFLKERTEFSEPEIIEFLKENNWWESEEQH